MKLRPCYKVVLTLGILIVAVVLTDGVIPRTCSASQTYLERLNAFPSSNVPLIGSAEVFWNKHQVPFIHASDDRDVPFLLGMVHAHLRLGQMEMMRRLSQGRLAEMFGPFAADADHALRIVDYGRAVPEIIQMLPPETRMWIRRYTDGINFYVQRSPSRPPALADLAIKPEPWSMEEIITMGRLGATDVNWFYWFMNLKLQKEPQWADFWERMIAHGSASLPSFGSDAGAPFRLLESAVKSGSNSYAVSGQHTRSGAGLIANDPHLGLMLPNLWVLIGFKSPGYHSVGLSIPGLPMVLVGRNPSIAWGGTNMLSMSSSLYDISDTRVDQLEHRQDRIRVRWWFDRSVTIRNSALGPVISDTTYLKKQGLPRLALKWRGHSASDEFTAFLKVNQAESWEEFRKAWETYAVSGQNIVYADRDGNIGQLMAIEFVPAAAKANKQFIANPNNPEYRWDVRYKSTQLPAILNPESGFLVSTNNIPIRTDPPVSLFGNANDRYRTILAQLQHSAPVDVADLIKIQTDVYSGNSFELAQAIARHASNTNTPTTRLLASLEKWDGLYGVDSSGAAALELAAFHLANDYYRERYGEKTAGYLMRSPAVYTFLKQDLDDPAMQKKFSSALAKAARDYKKYPAWGKLHYLRLRHPLGNIPLIGFPYRFGEYPVAGSTNTVMKRAHPLSNKKHYTTYGANARHISDLSDPDENYFVLVGGQDGFRGSANFLDLFEMWQRNEYLRFPLRLETIRTTFDRRIEINDGQP